MNCPLCIDTTLDITFHAGIELDICPRCRGVWLDRGEPERLAHDRPASGDDRDRPRQDRAGDRRQAKATRQPSRKQRKKRLADRLGDVFEEIIDL